MPVSNPREYDLYDKHFDMMKISNRISNMFINPEYELWIYETPNEMMKHNLVFIFGRKSGGAYRRLQTLEDFMPVSAFSSLSARKTVKVDELRPTLPPVPSGMVLQWIYYEYFASKDPLFAQLYQNFMVNVLRGGANDGPPEGWLSGYQKQKNIHQTKRILQAAPDELSTEEKKIPRIPIEVYQYRLLDDDNHPVFVTFLESYPLQAFFSDFTANEDRMFSDSTNVSVEELYQLIHGLQLRNGDYEMLGQKRQSSSLVFDPNLNAPSSSIFVIPWASGSVIQLFYTELQNLHPCSKPYAESLLPDSLRGFGKLEIEQPEPLSAGKGELTAGDLIIGYQKIEQPADQALFDFVVANDRRIPVGENLLIHFEVYQLQTGPGGIARFEVEYEIRPRGGLFGWTKKKLDEFTISLSFEHDEDRFAESLEIEAARLNEGKYELTWTIRDIQSGQNHEQQLQFEVVEK